MAFEGLTGQTKVKNILSDAAVSGRLGHAYMFVGPEGIGKKTFASEFAGLIMCRERNEKDGHICGVCESCRLNRQGFNPDCIRIELPEGKSSISVEAVRAIQESLLTAPVYGKKKVIIIENADKMTQQAQNALLKTLEEPPEYVVILLLTENKTLMLDTVKSRVVTVEFSRNTEEEISERFLRLYGEDKKDKLPLVLAYCDGIMGRIDVFGRGNGSEQIRNSIPEIIKNISSDKYLASKQINELIKKHEEAKSFVFFSMRSFYRDIQIASRYGSREGLMNPDFKETIVELAQHIGYHRAYKNGEILDETWKMICRNANIKLAVDRMVILLN